MPLIKYTQSTGQHQIVTQDPWSRLSPEENTATLSHKIVPIDQLDMAVTISAGPLGVLLKASDQADTISAYLAQVSLVEIEFSAFTDGRGFSKARLLRDKYNYKGEIRATGHILRDQLTYLIRCGVDAVEVRTHEDALTWSETVNRFDVAYQPAFDRRPWAEGLRQRENTSPKHGVAA